MKRVVPFLVCAVMVLLFASTALAEFSYKLKVANQAPTPMTRPLFIKEIVLTRTIDGAVILNCTEGIASARTNIKNTATWEIIEGFVSADEARLFASKWYKTYKSYTFSISQSEVESLLGRKLPTVVQTKISTSSTNFSSK